MSVLFETPILIVGWRRPDKMRALLAKLRDAKVARVWAAIDGPRDSSQLREVLSTQVAVRTGLDSKCEVKTRFQTENLGCRNHVVSAIDWFFSEVEAGIILEDDCLPSQEGLSFLSDMLARYSSSKDVFSVCLDNSLGVKPGNKDSYFFSRFPHVWGWGTWRRAWSLYDRDMEGWKTLRDKNRTYEVFRDRKSQNFWSPLFDRVAFPPIEDTWDWQWAATHFIKKGLSIHPTVNLVSNVGFDEDATHTRKVTLRANVPPATIFPLRHPGQVVEDKLAAKRTYSRLMRVLRKSRSSTVAKSSYAFIFALARVAIIKRTTAPKRTDG